MIVLIDNYDSFSYNLYQLIGMIDSQVEVIRNDAISVAELASMGPEAIVISPGPGRPEDAGICQQVVMELGLGSEDLAPETGTESGIGTLGTGTPGIGTLGTGTPGIGAASIPILGVCLGHQAICQALGARIGYAATLMHGKQSMTTLDNDCPLFTGCASEVPVARYHSLSAIEDTLPPCLKIVARADDGEVMAVQHQRFPLFGLQFHPESIMTPSGETMMRAFIDCAHRWRSR